MRLNTQTSSDGYLPRPSAPARTGSPTRRERSGCEAIALLLPFRRPGFCSGRHGKSSWCTSQPLRTYSRKSGQPNPGPLTPTRTDKLAFAAVVTGDERRR